jgi:hypothetical protein
VFTGEFMMKTLSENTCDPNVVLQKLNDANTPGFLVEVDPEEAELLGAFVEDALDEQSALVGSIELQHNEFDDAQKIHPVTGRLS